MTITNGDLPAMPITNEQAQDADMWGLSKREMMAMHILPALIATYDVDWVATQGESVARDAVIYADALLAELERAK